MAGAWSLPASLPLLFSSFAATSCTQGYVMLLCSTNVAQQGTPRQEPMAQEGTPRQEAMTQEGTPRQEATPEEGTPRQVAMAEEGTPRQEAMAQEGTPRQEAMALLLRHSSTGGHQHT